MSLNLNVIHTAVRITSAGDLLGTGFVVSVPSETLPRDSWDYLVTANHVVDNQIHIEAQVPNPFSNGALYDPVPVDDWKQGLPGADLAIAPFPRTEEKRRSFSIESMIPVDHVEVLLGATIYYVGIFEPLQRPIARSGSLAARDQEGLQYRGDYSYTAHLVDCRSYKGFSGSPCFIQFAYPTLDEIPAEFLPWERISVANPPRIGNMAYYPALCGLFTGHFSDDESQSNVPSSYGVGVMLRSHEIKEALMTDERREERKRWDAELDAARKARQPSIQDTSFAAPPNEPDEFGRFEDLTGRLLKVPKKELDEIRRQEE